MTDPVWTEPVTNWITTSQVIHFHGLKPQHLNLQKTDDYTMRSILSDWIQQSQALILSYCHILKRCISSISHISSRIIQIIHVLYFPVHIY